MYPSRANDHRFFNNNTVGGSKYEQWLTAPDQRPESEPQPAISPCAEMRTNRYGVTEREYELVPHSGGAMTGWVRYECRCGRMVWKRCSLSLARGCGSCGQQGATLKYDLLGQKHGRLEVVGRVRGKGWDLLCACGRHKFSMNSTAIAAGMLKTCGRCYDEDGSNADKDATTATESAGASSVAYDNMLSSDNIQVCESSAHTKIVWWATDDDNGWCPLCIALARIELLS